MLRSKAEVAKCFGTVDTADCGGPEVSMGGEAGVRWRHVALRLKLATHAISKRMTNLRYSMGQPSILSN